MKPILKDVSLIGIVVNNLMDTVKDYSNIYGVGPWSIWELNYSNTKKLFAGESGDGLNALIAQAKIDNITWEIIEPLDDKSIYSEFLIKHGEGLHHLGYSIEKIEDALDYFKNKNIDVLQGWRWSSMDFAYFDLSEDLKHIAKFYCGEAKVFKPDKIYPNKGVMETKPLFNKIRQVGMVTRDIKKTTQIFSDKYGVFPWKYWKYFSPKTKDMFYLGNEVFDQKFTTSAIIPNISDVEIEYMEPTSGKSIYFDHLDRHGEGLQHVSFIYNLPFDEVIGFHQKKGDKIIQQGEVNKAIYAYIDTSKDLKIISEIFYLPDDFEMPESDVSYPG